MHPLVSHLENKLLPTFREVAEGVCDEFSNVSAQVYSQSVGALTEYQGHLIIIECLIKDAPDDRPDIIALGVELERLAIHPKIIADVCWGHPSGFIEAEFSAGALEVSDEVLADLFQQLPMLYRTLIEAIRRGKPSNWNEVHA